MHLDNKTKNKNDLFDATWIFYIVKNSKWIEELTNPKNIILDPKEDYVHYAIIGEDYVFEVVSVLKPEIIF